MQHSVRSESMDALDLSGKVALVTGAAGGIGSAVVSLLIARGAKVGIADIDLDRARQLAQTQGEGRAVAVSVDLASEASIKKMVAEVLATFGKLDILHNNAAALSPDLVQRDLDVGSMDTEVWDQAFAVNCRGAMLTIREALPHLLESKGCIINTASNTAFQGHFLLTAYTASKAALIQLTRSVAASYGRNGLRCNAVAPGTIMTPSLEATFPESARRLVEDETLMTQLGEPKDVAEVVAFLASSAAHHLTGQVIVVDGGLSSHVPGMAQVRALFEGM